MYLENTKTASYAIYNEAIRRKMWMLTNAYVDAGGTAECYTDSCRMDESSFDVSVIDDDLWWALPAELQGAENRQDLDEATEKYLR